MAKFKLTAGAEFDMLTRDEVTEVLRNWSQELTRGARFRRRSLTGTVNAVGELLAGGVDDGPHEGFVWALTRLAVTSSQSISGGVNVYVNDASPSSLLIPSLTYVEYPGDHGIVLTSGDHLVIAGSEYPADTIVTVTMTIKEVPSLMAWSL